MKLIEIQELIDFIKKSGLEEVSIETEVIKLHVKRGAVALNPAELVNHTDALQSEPLGYTHILNQKEHIDPTSNYIVIKSPMVGTFYRASSPDDLPFVQKGDKIMPGTKLCIIEAMKLYNDIESEISGEIIDILVEDVSPVAYDQPLFLVNPM